MAGYSIFSPNMSMSQAMANITGYTPVVSPPKVDIPYINPTATYDTAMPIQPNNWLTSSIERLSPNLYNKYPNTMNGINNDWAEFKGALGDLGNGVKTTWGDMDGKQKFDTISGALQGLYGIYNGNQQLKVAKDTFNFNKQAWQKNYDAQAKMVNSQLEDRQARRARLSDKNVSVSDYMNKYGVK